MVDFAKDVKYEHAIAKEVPPVVRAVRMLPASSKGRDHPDKAFDIGTATALIEAANTIRDLAEANKIPLDRVHVEYDTEDWGGRVLVYFARPENKTEWLARIREYRRKNGAAKKMEALEIEALKKQAEKLGYTIQPSPGKKLKNENR